MSGEFSSVYRVSWVDTDAAGVVHFSNYFRIFERVEEEMYLNLEFSFKDLYEKYGIWLPRVEAHCHFISPAYFGDVLDVKLRVIEIGEKHVKYGFKILRSGNIIAEGHVVVVTADKKLNKAVPIPTEFREKIKKYLV
ncbi:MAG: thioesterase family protein [Candidatus Caldarchaeales archaeon]